MRNPAVTNCLVILKKAAPFSDAFILAHHGPVVGGTSLMETFFGLEELEESCKIAWTFQHT
mgnify:CR=1 FL=1